MSAIKFEACLDFILLLCVKNKRLFKLHSIIYYSLQAAYMVTFVFISLDMENAVHQFLRKAHLVTFSTKLVKRSCAVIISFMCYFICSKDFDILGEKMVSCGMDHSLKIWSLETDAMKKVCQITDSLNHSLIKTCAWKFFLLVLQKYIEFSY